MLTFLSGLGGEVEAWVGEVEAWVGEVEAWVGEVDRMGRYFYIKN